METDFLTFNQADEFIKRCKKEGIFIYGIERFLCKNGIKVPDLNGSADFSSLSTAQVSKSTLSSRKFLALFGDTPLERFKIVCE